MDLELEVITKKIYSDWVVSSYLSENDFVQYVEESYPLILERAKMGQPIYYGELPCFSVLQSRFADGVQKVIGLIVGACSEYDIENDRPPISAIVIGQDSNKPGTGFFGLSKTPPHLSTVNWEHIKINPPSDIVLAREKLWFKQLNEVFEYWKGK